MEQIVYETNCHWSIFSMRLLVRGHDFQVCWSTNPVPSCQQPWPQNEKIRHRPGVLLVCLIRSGKGNIGISMLPYFQQNWMKENFVGNPYDYRGYNMVSRHITRKKQCADWYMYGSIIPTLPRVLSLCLCLFVHIRCKNM